jgi:hypothetical protein
LLFFLDKKWKKIEMWDDGGSGEAEQKTYTDAEESKIMRFTKEAEGRSG